MPDWPSVVDQFCVDHTFDYVALSGGEPLLYRGLTALVERLVSNGQRVIVTTNGRIATRRRLRDLAAAGLTVLQVPLLSGGPEIHDALAGRNSWRPAARAILEAALLSIEVSVTIVVTSQNVFELPKIVTLAHALGVENVVINEVHVHGQGGRRQAHAPDPADLMTQVHEAKRLAPEVALHVLPSSTALRRLLPDLNAGRPTAWHRLTIGPAGQVKLCNQSGSSLGSVVALRVC